MIATLQEDYVTFASSKGMSSRYILFRHALRPSSLTLLTVAGLNVGALIGGALVIEVIFGLPGIGPGDRQRHPQPAVHRPAEHGRHRRHRLRPGERGHRHPLRGTRSEDSSCLRHPEADPAVTSVAVTGPGSDVPQAYMAGVLGTASEAVIVDTIELAPQARVGVGGWLAVGWLSVIVFAALAAPLLPIDDPYALAEASLDPPSANHWFGTDGTGRDVFARVIWGARSSLLVSVERGADRPGRRRRPRSHRRLHPGPDRDRVDHVLRRHARLPPARAGAVAGRRVRQRRQHLGHAPDGGPHRRPGHRGHPDPGPHHPGQHAHLVPARVRHRRPVDGRQVEPDPRAGGAAQRPAGRCSRSACSASRWPSWPRAG